MRKRTNGLVIALTLASLSVTPLQGQRLEEAQRLTLAAAVTEASAPDMADFLRSAAARMHCCTTEQFLDGAILYKRAAEHGLNGDAEDRKSAVHDLRLAGYFFYYAGEFDRAFSALARVGVIERDFGDRTKAATAFLEAAHIARRTGDLKRARDLLLASEQVPSQP